MLPDDGPGGGSIVNTAIGLVLGSLSLVLGGMVFALGGRTIRSALRDGWTRLAPRRLQAAS